MAIDTIIGYNCIPKQTLTSEGILERIKGKERAETIITLFRRNGDNRPPTEMGFEMVRTAANGTEEMQVVVVQHLLDSADELQSLEHHCVGCPANAASRPFGCMGQIRYPISGEAEAWLLNQLPGSEEPLVWLLLRQGIQEFNYDGSTVRPLRAAGTTHFAEQRTITRNLVEFDINTDQIFEMTFLLGDIQPNHAGVLLLFFNAIERGIEADQIIKIGRLPPEERTKFSFLHKIDPKDDLTTVEIKHFLYALYVAWRLNVLMFLDV
jgi:hypothetical protein